MKNISENAYVDYVEEMKRLEQDEEGKICLRY